MSDEIFLLKTGIANGGSLDLDFILENVLRRSYPGHYKTNIGFTSKTKTYKALLEAREITGNVNGQISLIWAEPDNEILASSIDMTRTNNDLDYSVIANLKIKGLEEMTAQGDLKLRSGMTFSMKLDGRYGKYYKKECKTTSHLFIFTFSGDKKYFVSIEHSPVPNSYENGLNIKLQYDQHLHSLIMLYRMDEYINSIRINIDAKKRYELIFRVSHFFNVRKFNV